MGMSSSRLSGPCFVRVSGVSSSSLLCFFQVDRLKTFISSHFVPSRMVLVGVNTDHQQMVDLAQEHFVRPVTSWEGVDPLPVDVSIAQYTGGQKLVCRCVFVAALCIMLEAVNDLFLVPACVGGNGRSSCGWP